MLRSCILCIAVHHFLKCRPKISRCLGLFCFSFTCNIFCILIVHRCRQNLDCLIAKDMILNSLSVDPELFGRVGTGVMNRKHCSWSLTWLVGCVTWARFITWWLYISQYLCADVGVSAKVTPPDFCCFLSKNGCLTHKQKHQNREKWMWQRPNESQTTSDSKDNINWG